MRPIPAVMIARSHSIGETRWSPSGTRLGWLDSWDGRTDLVVAPADGSSPPAVVSATFPVSPAGGYGGGAWCWLDDERVVVAGADGRLVVLAADGAGVLVELTRDGEAASPAVSRDGALVACSIEWDDRCDIAVMPADGLQWPQRWSTGADYSWDPAWGADGSLVWHEWDLTGMSWDASRLARRDPDGRVQIIAGGDDIAVGQPRFSPDGTRLAYVCDAETGYWNVWAADADGADARPVSAEPHDAAEPAWGPGQRSFAWSPDSRSIAWSRDEDGFGRLVVATLDADGSWASPRGVAKAVHDSLDWGAGGILALRSGARTPTTLTITDPANGARRAVARGPVGGFETAGLVEPEAVTWPCGDVTVHGLLYRPAEPALGAGTRPPLLVDIHGGPTDQRRVAWSPLVAYWVSRGWAVLQVNYRGSTGYGRAYMQALEQRWGEVDVDDVIAGIEHARTAGWCDRERVVVMGGSAGGMTVLLVCAKRPDLVRAGVDLYGLSDLFDLETHRFESRYNDRLVGLLPQDAERFRRNSPVTYAADIRVPLLVLQGSADKVVPQSHSDAIVAAVRAAGGEVEYHVYEGEGHGFRRLPNVIDQYERTERFLTKWVLQR